MRNEAKTVLVIGGGTSGLEASAILSKLGYSVTIVEKKETIGGHLLNWDRLFPNKKPAGEILQAIESGINGNTNIVTSEEIQSVTGDQPFEVTLSRTKTKISADAILVSTGFDVFNANKKEEYGYGIYDHVITSVELEHYFSKHQMPLKRDGTPVKRLAFIHCVGSRDEKAGIRHCSRVCCVTAVKQAIEVKEIIPDASIYMFYMDLRMFGLGFEELYKEAQEIHRIRFIRGRLSESFENSDGSIMVKVEDTLAGKPLRLNVDLMVLMVGMLPANGTKELAGKLGLSLNQNEFFQPKDLHYAAQMTEKPGIFLAGTCKSPKNVEESLADARAAALQIDNYLKKM
jgi:heterodisulfide reductase subunit A